MQPVASVMARAAAAVSESRLKARIGSSCARGWKAERHVVSTWRMLGSPALAALNAAAVYLNERADIFGADGNAGTTGCGLVCIADGGKPNMRREVRVRCAASAKPASCAAVESEPPFITISHASRNRRHSM